MQTRYLTGQLLELSGVAKRLFRASKSVTLGTLIGGDHFEPLAIAFFALTFFFLLLTKRFHCDRFRFQFQPIEMRPLFKTKSRRSLLDSWKSRFRYHGTQGANKLADYIAWLAG